MQLGAGTKYDATTCTALVVHGESSQDDRVRRPWRCGYTVTVKDGETRRHSRRGHDGNGLGDREGGVTRAIQDVYLPARVGLRYGLGEGAAGSSAAAWIGIAPEP